MKELIKKVLKILGHALTVSVHDRLDHVDHALDLVIDQNNRMARTQTALLQSSIHIVNALNRLQADLTAVRRSANRTSGRTDLIVEAVDRTLAEVTALRQSAEGQVDQLESDRTASHREAFFQLYTGLPRQGPGSTESTRRAIQLLPNLPAKPFIVDAGCGTGAQTLVLARELGGRILAVDTHQPFLDELAQTARSEGLDQMIETRCLSMDALEEPDASVNLIWSEGAIYQVGVSRALERWWPLLRSGGSIGFTEITWLTDDPPDEIVSYWRRAYPSIGTEETNRRCARQAGYEVRDTFVLPAEDWWRDYYAPLRQRCAKLLQGTAVSEGLHQVIAETEEEIQQYERYGEHYGYVFYLLSKP